MEIISELGLRYQPSATADMQAHTARILLLAGDVADLNPLKLRVAANRWARNRPYLPKASELHAIVEDIEAGEHGFGGREGLEDWCADKNDWAKRIGADWWYRVASRLIDGNRTFYVEKLEGWRAIEECARAEGKVPKWYKPTDADAEAIHAYARKCMDEGMTQDEFSDHVRRTGGCPRT